VVYSAIVQGRDEAVAPSWGALPGRHRHAGRIVPVGTEGSCVKKLIIAVVQNEDADTVVDALLEDEFRATRLASTGGFLRRGNTTLMVGAQDDQVDRVLDLIRTNARNQSAPANAAEQQSAAATVFVLDLEEYQRL